MRRGDADDNQLVIDILEKAFDENKSVNYSQTGRKKTGTDKGPDGVFVQGL